MGKVSAFYSCFKLQNKYVFKYDICYIDCGLPFI